MVREKAGYVFEIARENRAITGCTVSKQVYQENGYSIFHFSLAEGTEISPESYEYAKCCIVWEGTMEVMELSGRTWRLGAGDSFLFPPKIPVGVRTEKGCCYTELSVRKETVMNQVIKAGEVFRLGELLPYQDGKIVNMDLVNEPKMKFVVMSFDEGTGLSEHAAPGEALVFALDGEGMIGYEGKEFPIHAGETFKFDKFGKHSVKAVKRFKMALLLVLE